MITKEGYQKALSIINEYHDQITAKSDIVDGFNKTPFNKWEGLDKSGGRLKRVLAVLLTERIETNRYDYKWSNGNYIKIGLPDKMHPPRVLNIEDVNELSFLRLKNSGKKTWEEFQTLRGY